nr:putative disease resistance protein RGA4 [Ziziphus jujuba var. spinosa]
METLPNSFDKVKHLRYIDLSSNSMKKLPGSITRLYNLQTLILTGCTELLSLPRNLKYMINLRHLLIDGCKKLTHMPSGLGELTSLSTLDRFVMAKNKSKWKDASGFAELSHLNNLIGKLEIHMLSHNLQGDAGKSEAAILKKQHLQSLYLMWKRNNDIDDGCDIAKDDEILLDDLQPHPNLKAFRVESFIPLQQTAMLMKAVASPNSLTPPLELESTSSSYYYYSVNFPEEIANLSSSLHELHIKHCTNLTSLPKGIGNLSAFDSLDIRGCPNLVTLPHEVANLSSLRSLRIESCDKLESLPEEMHRLISLAKLGISKCHNLESLLEGISNLSSLTYLSIEACCKLVSLPQGMHRLTSLSYLNIS